MESADVASPDAASPDAASPDAASPDASSPDASRSWFRTSLVDGGRRLPVEDRHMPGIDLSVVSGETVPSLSEEMMRYSGNLTVR